jgi:hypothetical protein
MDVILLIHLSTCLLMTGVIWIVQVVHYPTFRFINNSNNNNFNLFSSFHVKSIGSIVVPLMLVEAITATLLVIKYSSKAIYINFSLLIITWLFTFLVSMPLHKNLQKRHDFLAIEKLIKTNWSRTILWTIRCICLLAFITKSLGVLQ